MADLVTELADYSLDVGGLGETDVVVRVRDECQELALQAVAVVLFKRRLADGSSSELARDKRIARRAANLLNNVVEPEDWQVLRANAASTGWNVQAAVIKWDEWLPTAEAQLRRLMVLCATWLARNVLSADVRATLWRLSSAADQMNLDHLARTIERRTRRS